LIVNHAFTTQNYSKWLSVSFVSEHHSDSYIGLGEANIWGCEGFLPEFSQTYPKSFVGLSLQNFSTKIKDHEDPFLYDIVTKE